MPSLRTRLLMGIIGGMVLLLIVFSVIIYMVIRRALIDQFDASLAATARILAASVEQDDEKIELELDFEKIELELDFEKMPEFQRTQRPAYYQLWGQDGTVVARSPSLGTEDISHLDDLLVDGQVFRALQMKTGQPGRAVALKFEPRIEDLDANQMPPEQQTLTLVVARDAGDLQYNLQFLRWLLFSTSLGTVTLSLLIAAFVVRQGLSPLNSLAADIASISENNLTARIGTEQMPAEVLPVRKKLNDLLARLEDSFNRERRFTADVAHELRTPLAGIRSILEVTLARLRNENEYQAALSDCLAISKNMQATVDNLLTLARIDAHQMTFHRDRILLAELVNSSWRPFSNRARQRSIVFENRIPPEITCESDTDSLSMVLSNLMDNAVEYTNQAGQIWTTARRTDDSIEFTIANTGCQLSDEQASQVFDCFWRGDSSRTDTGVHCGLGLALVQKLVAALGGCANVEVLNGGIFTLRLAIPAS